MRHFCETAHNDDDDDAILGEIFSGPFDENSSHKASNLADFSKDKNLGFDIAYDDVYWGDAQVDYTRRCFCWYQRFVHPPSYQKSSIVFFY
jgi:hypothetical protein